VRRSTDARGCCARFDPSRCASSSIVGPSGVEVALTQKHVLCSDFVRVSDGTRTRDRLDHNQELYLLSYAHREAFAM
jgi:hypothetical protein